MMAAFLQKLKSTAFDGLDVECYDVDLQGWMNPEFRDVFRKALAIKNPEDPLTIIEVGTWKGLSTTTMATIAKEQNFKDVNIVAVDTWLGAPEFWTTGLDDPTRYGSLRCNMGYPSVFYTFTKNVKKLGHDDCIAPLPISSVQGADVLKYYNIMADVIYIDAAHEYEPVYADIQSYFPLLKPGGTLIGDDYTGGWPGVVKAVNEFAHAHGMNHEVYDVFWSITKQH